MPEPQATGRRATSGSATDADREQGAMLAGLLAQIALGDRKAFAALYDNVKSPLFRTALRVCDDRAMAEEVLQEVFVNIWRGAQSYNASRSHPMAWLLSVARYRAIDHVRMRQSAPTTVSTFNRRDADGDGEIDILDSIPSELPGPDALQEHASDAQALARCMRRLSAEQRRAIALAYYEGCTHSQIAQRLAQPLGSVKSWVRRGLTALQRCMGAAVSGNATSSSEGA